jgi:hypothetical protein
MAMDEKFELKVDVLYNDKSLKDLDSDLSKAKKSADGLGKELDSTNRQTIKSSNGFQGLSKGTQSVRNDFSKMGNTLKNIAKGFAIFAAAGVAAVAGVAIGLKKLLDIGIQTQNGIRQTEQVIKSTGGAAKVSAKDIDRLTQSMMNKTGADDDLIRNGANILLTFTKIRNEAGQGNDMFNQATEAALNMSVALKKDLSSSSIMVGKALNDPLKGVTALGRAGVQFTEQQKTQIETLVETGRTMQAQKMIMAELTTQFGGQAEAQMQPTERLRNVVGNLSEEIGMSLVPNADRGANAIGDMVIKMTNEFRAGEGVMGDFKRNLSSLTGSVAKFFEDMNKGIGQGGKFKEYIGDSATQLMEFINEMRRGEGQGGDAREAMAGFVEMLKNLTIVLMAALPIIELLATLSGGLLKAFSALDGTTQTLIVTALILGKAFLTINSAVMAMGGTSLLASTGLGSLAASMGAAALAAAPIIAAIAIVAGTAYLFYKNWDQVKIYAASNWESLKKIFSSGVNFVSKLIKFGMLAPVNLIKTAWRGLKTALSTVWGGIKSGFSMLTNGILTLSKYGFLGPVALILSRWGQIKSFFQSLPGKIAGFFSNLGSTVARPFIWAYTKIKNVLDKIVGAFNSAIDKIQGAMGQIKSAPGSVLSGIGDVLGFADGGKVGPNSGGARLFVAGEGKSDEWVISQDGPRQKNQNLLMDAASKIFGKDSVQFFANGGKVRSAETRLARASLTPNLQDDLRANIALRDIYRSSVNVLDRRLSKDKKGRDWYDKRYKNPKKARNARNAAKDTRLSDLGSWAQYRSAIISLRGEMKGGSDIQGPSIAEQINSFNSERMSIANSFASNVRALTASSVAGKAYEQNNVSPKAGNKPPVIINNTYTEPPKDAHSWTRNVQNEIIAAGL